MKKLLFIILLLCSSIADAQHLFHQDLFHGGVTVGGVNNSSAGGDFSANISLFAEPGSTIRKAYLFSGWSGYERDSHYVMLNGIKYDFLEANLVTMVNHTHVEFDDFKVFFADITDSIDLSNLNYEIYIPIFASCAGNNDCIKSVTIYIEYDNPNLSVVNSCINLVNEEIDENVVFDVQNLNPIDTNFPVGNASYVAQTTYFNIDATKIVLVDGVNLIDIGEVYGSSVPEPNNYGTGTVGQFYYQNNQLFGLSDDTPDNIVDSSDALYDMSSYVLNGTKNYEQRFIKSGPHESNDNIPMYIFNAYTTPCDTFSVGITSDTIICKGDSVQLQAWGNTHYNWLYGTNISDTTIANPYVSPDSSQLYTVLINDGNGCGKTANVFVQVLESPSITELAITETSCGLEEGIIEVTQTQNTQAGYQFSLNGGSLQESSVFDSLSYGNYYIQIQNPNGCVGDTGIFVPYNITTIADFTANPTEGYAPLNVNFTNHSQNANHYLWDFGNTNTSTEEHPNTNYPQTGSYEIELIAYLNDTICADTTGLIIYVYNPIQAIIPNVITPNGDGFNEVFSIQIEGAIKLTASFRNRWGNELEKVSKDLSGAQEKVVLWSPTEISPGTYFYEIEAEDALGEKQFFQGFVVVRM